MIEETIDNILKPKFVKNIFSYDENEIISNLNSFIKVYILNHLMKENCDINRGSDKILEIIKIWLKLQGRYD